jgi:hypothetical protein
LRDYQIDLPAALVSGEMSVRRFRVLLSGLSSDAAVWREENDWPMEHELAAATLERLDERLWHLALLSNPKQPSKLPKPIRVPRPASVQREQQQERRRKVETDPRVIAAQFARLMGE